MAIDYKMEASLLSLGDLSKAEQVEKLLDVLENDPHGPPSHWGRSDAVRMPFDGKALRAWLDKLDPDEGLVPSVRRTKRPRYLLTWFAGLIHPHAINIESTFNHEPFELPALLDLCDRLAATMDVDFGIVNLTSDEHSEATLMHPDGAMPHVTAYIEGGIETLYHRNYFGPRVVALAGGIDVFRRASPHVRVLASGTIVLDLAESILDASPEALKSAQVSALRKLAPTGILEAPSGAPGDNWQSPPGAWSE